MFLDYISAQPSANKSFTQQTGTFYVEFRYKLPSTNWQRIVVEDNDQSGGWPHLNGPEINWAYGKTMYRNAAGNDTDVMSVSADTWYDVKLKIYTWYGNSLINNIDNADTGF